MKTSTPGSKQHSGNHRIILLIGGFAALGQFCATAGETTPAETKDEPEAPANWIDLTVGGFSNSGNDAAFQSRMGNNGDFYGGVRSMHYEQAMDGGTFTVDGHALFGLEDYELNLGYTKDDVGYIRGGYREFRTWYDGSGGFVSNTIYPGWRDPITLYDDELHLDRGELWFEAGLRMENIPEITFGYSHRWRDGQKDSTIWGLDGNLNGGLGFIPTYLDIDETRDTFTLDVAHTLGNTDLELGLRYDMVDNENDKHLIEDADFVHKDVYSYDLFGASMTSTTRFNDRMMAGFGYLYTTMDTDIGGSSRSEDGLFLNGSHSFPGIAGGADFQQHVINGNFWWNPNDCFVVVPSIRAEWQDSSGFSQGFLDGAVGTGFEDWLYANDTNIEEITEAIEFRYTGFENVLLYATAEMRQSDEDLDLVQIRRNAANLTQSNLRKADIETDTEKYTIGANWYPVRGISVAAQYYYKSLDQDFDNRLSGTPAVLDAELYRHGYETNDANLRVTWRARPNLTFVTRYDYQQTEYTNSAYWNGFVLTDVTTEIESAEISRHILSESVTWNVNDRCFVQGSVSWINSETETPADDGPNASPVGLIPDWDNDFIVVTLGTGYAIDAKTSLTANYSYYRTDGYDSFPGAMSYGLNTREHGVSLTLNRQINANMACYLTYGFVTSNTNSTPDQSGGYNDFDAHMVSTGLQIRF